MYEPAYDDKHRLLLFAPARAVDGGGIVSKPPTAPYDSTILCPDCDNRKLNAYEDYAAKVLFGKNLPGTIAPSVQNFKDPSTGFGETIVERINYSRLKLFM